MVLQNTQAFPALIMNSNFAGNTAITSLVQLRNAQMEIKACKFNDNYANLIAHGFVLYQSSLIARSLSFNQSGERITGGQPISGAFFLSAGSSLQLLDGSVIQKTSGQVASAVYLESDSSMLATKVTFANMKISEAILSKGTGVIVASFAKELTLSQCTFVACDNTNIFAEDTEVAIN